MVILVFEWCVQWSLIFDMEEQDRVVVGRERELAALAAFLRHARHESAVLAFDGVPGIGKTTLWRAGVDRARAEGTAVLTTRAAEAETGLSLTGLSDLFGEISDDILRALAGPQAGALSVALLRAPAPAEGVDERALFASVLSVLRVMSAKSPVIVAVDDAQWLDTASARALTFAVRRLDTERVGFLVAVRDDGQSVDSFERAADGRREHVTLGALSVGALHAVIKRQTGLSLPRPTAVRVAQVSGGNPLYAIEIASELQRAGTDASEMPVPRSLATLIEERVSRLPAATRVALAAAAAASHPTIDLVDVEILEPAEKMGIVSVRDGHVRFLHPVFASAVYRSVDQATRRRVHRQLAVAVTESEERARHLALGSAGPDETIAAKLDEAAAVVAARGAPEAAAELIDLAIRSTAERHIDARSDRRIAGARFRFDSGDLGGAEALLYEVIDQGADGSQRACALQLLARLHGRRSNFADAFAAATEALALVSGDDVLRTEIELDVAYCCASLGDFEAAQVHARAAVAGAEATGSETLPETLAVLTMTEFLGGRGFDEPRIRRAIELENPLRSGAFMMRPRYILGVLLLWTGRCTDATALLEGLRMETIERGEEGAVPFLAPYLTWAALWRGDITGAARIVDGARESAGLLGDPAAEAIAAGFNALVHAFIGPAETVRGEAAKALELFSRLQWMPGTIWPLWAIGLVSLVSDDPAAVDAALGPLAQLITDMGSIDPALAVFLPEEIEALTQLGRADEAEQLTAWLDERAEAVDRPWARAVASRCRGLVLSARGKLDLAVASLDDALRQYDSLDLPIERARTLLALGRVQRRRKQKRLARLAFDEAFEVFEAVGATLWSARVRDELSRVNTRRALTTLTPTEERIARFAAEGFSNREIAEHAFVSPKTVEANLARAYRKLEISSRAQLARALDRHPRTVNL